jgi:hypothetical protein
VDEKDKSNEMIVRKVIESGDDEKDDGNDLIQ